MVKKRTVVIICLLTTIVLASTLLRTDIFSTVHAPSTLESEFAQIPLDETVVTEADEVTFEEPEPIKVTPASPSTTAKRCYVTGCSGQLCSSEQGMMSTCEYKEEYACYQRATCEVQAGGECGWTETSELSSCIANAGSEVEGAVDLAI